MARRGRPNLGKWIGPEGLVLEVTAMLKNGEAVVIKNQWTLDDKGAFEGSVTPTGPRWRQKNTPVIAVFTTGDVTGTKWLAGKKHA